MIPQLPTPMRPLAFLSLLLACSGVLHAQDQERHLIDRILQPDMSLGNWMQTKAYYSGGAAGLDSSRSANVKDYYVSQQFSAKSYDTKDYTSSKGFWQGDFHFSTKSADVKTDPNADKLYETKSAPVKDAHESGKDYVTRDKEYATREAIEKGKTSQAHLDETFLGKNRGQMNMDQVRDLLNKNHGISLPQITSPQ
jgi:hypothetical protein